MNKDKINGFLKGYKESINLFLKGEMTDTELSDYAWLNLQEIKDEPLKSLFELVDVSHPDWNRQQKEDLAKRMLIKCNELISKVVNKSSGDLV